MSYRGLATVLLRCSGLISIVIGLFHLAGFVPMIWDVTWNSGAPGASGVIRTVLLPSFAGVVGGLVLFFLAASLARLAVRGLE